jgi:hypothetical protein
MNAERIENLWGSFDLISAELVKAKRALRERWGTEADVHYLQAKRMDIGIELSSLGEAPDWTEPCERTRSGCSAWTWFDTPCGGQRGCPASHEAGQRVVD